MTQKIENRRGQPDDGKEKRRGEPQSRVCIVGSAAFA